MNNNTRQETCITILRISDTKEDRDNQKVMTDSFINKKGWQNLATVNLDGKKRFDMTKYKPRIFQAVKEHRPDHVVYRDTTRIGFRTVKQLIRFIDELEDFGTKTWVAQGERCLNEEGYDIHRLVEDQSASIAEVNKLSYRVQIGRRRMVNERGSTPGIITPYGYDMAYYGREGRLKYIIRYEGWKLFPGEHGDRKPNTALQRTKLYPDGRTEDYNDTWRLNEQTGEYELDRHTPAHERGLRRLVIPNKDRAEVVKEIFRLADTPLWHTPYEIACILRRRNILPLRGEEFDGRTVETMLRNQVYKGRPCEHSGIKSIVPTFNDIVEYKLSDEEREGIRLVSEDQWNRVNNHMDSRTKWYKRTRRPDTGKFWCKPFLRCACGSVVYIATMGARQYYRCPKCGGVRVGVIHDLIDKWIAKLPDLTRVNHQHTDAREGIVKQLVAGMFGQPETFHKSCWLSTVHAMFAFIINQTAGDEQHDTLKSYFGNAAWQSSDLLGAYWNLPVPDFNNEPDEFETVYLTLFNKANETTINEIADIDARLALLQRELENGNNLQTVLAAVQSLENQKKTLEASLISLVPEYRRQKELLRSLSVTLAKLHADLAHANGEDKTVKLQPFLDRVILHFRERTHRTSHCRLARVEIIPTPKGLPGITFDADNCAAAVHQHDKRSLAETQARKSATMKALHAARRRN